MFGKSRCVRVLLALPDDATWLARNTEHDDGNVLLGDEIDSMPRLSLSLGYLDTFFDNRLVMYRSVVSRIDGFVGISIDGGLFGDRNESMEFWLLSEMRSCCCG